MPDESKINRSAESKNSFRKVPVLIHVFNITASVLLWPILFIGGVNKGILIGAVIILCCCAVYYTVYYYFRNSENAMSLFFSFSLCIFIYIIFAESIFSIQNLTGLNFCRQLELSSRLQKYAVRKLKTQLKDEIFIGSDSYPIFYRRQPGSIHRRRLADNTNYEAIVDETGYLNLNRGAYNAAKSIDIFVSGDSVMQGVGMPSCLEQVKAILPFSLWNLSTGSYDSYQKAMALTIYALPKHPKLVVLEFFSGNDICEANEDDVVKSNPSCRFETRFSPVERELLFARSVKYMDIINNESQHQGETNFLTPIRINNLTLALTRNIIKSIKGLFGYEKGYWARKIRERNYDFFAPANYYFVKPEKYDEWMNFGIENTLNNYKMLLRAARAVKHPPRIAIMYNPSSYEIYRGILTEPEKQSDHRAAMQFNALRAFAKDNSIIFIDLLPAFRRKIDKKPPVMLYDIYDLIHWSPQGTKIAAEVIAEELKTILTSK
ncbi:MAG: hypothetical protein ABII64_10860 [Elusimicrobiota bacterium]